MVFLIIIFNNYVFFIWTLKYATNKIFTYLYFIYSQKNTSFGEAITDAMATVVDGVASAAATLFPVQSPPPVAQYRRQEDVVDVLTVRLFL